jgi:hypothetical protein
VSGHAPLALALLLLLTPTAPAALAAGLWWPVRDGVRERADVSADSGRTWQPSFDLIFHPHQRK